ncbi:MAG: hypothetical protein WC277_04010 [Bacilli bacterium]
MLSIKQIESKIKRYLPHEVNNRVCAVKMLRNGASIEFICRKYNISKTSPRHNGKE